jgi:5-methylcytosine-specific restriction endonuclease McrA
VEEDRLQNDKIPAGDPKRDADLAQLTAFARSDRTDHLRWRKEFYSERLLLAKPTALDPDRLFDKTVLSILLRKQGKKCAKCGKGVDKKTSEVDHIVAHVKGGETDISNAQLLCVECNRSKGAR